MAQLKLLIQENIDAQTITTREGSIVDTSGDEWHLPYAYYSNASIDFRKIDNPSIRKALNHYISRS